MIFLVWLVLCYFVWPTVEIFVTGSRTVSTTDGDFAFAIVKEIFESRK